MVAMMELGMVGSGLGKGMASFHTRQPISPTPASHGQLAYSDSPLEFLGPSNTRTRASTLAASPRQSVPAVWPLVQTSSLTGSKAAWQAGEFKTIPSFRPSSPSQTPSTL